MPEEDLAAGPALVRPWLGANERIFWATNLNQITTHSLPHEEIPRRKELDGWMDMMY